MSISEINSSHPLSPEELGPLNNRFRESSVLELLQWAAGRFGSGLRYACSFGAEDVALLDLIVKADIGARVFVLDTGRLHEETYEVLDRLRTRYGVVFETYHPDGKPLSELIAAKGTHSFYESIENRKECCFIRKVEPLQRALQGAAGWITGLRREQSVTRVSLEKIEIDASSGGILKLNPLADWSQEQVWEYIRANDVPYNSLHDRGFPSIGCAPCTRAVKEGEDLRAGRWWWESADHKECGLHARKS